MRYSWNSANGNMTALDVENENARTSTFVWLYVTTAQHSTSKNIHMHRQTQTQTLTYTLRYLKRKHCSISMCVDGRVYFNAYGCCHLSVEINWFPANTYKHKYIHMVSHPFSPLTQQQIFYQKLFHYSLFSSEESITFRVYDSVRFEHGWLTDVCSYVVQVHSSTSFRSTNSSYWRPTPIFVVLLAQKLKLD